VATGLLDGVDATAVQLVGFFLGGFLGRAGRSPDATPRARAIAEAGRVGFLGSFMKYAYVTQHAAYMAVHQVVAAPSSSSFFFFFFANRSVLLLCHSSTTMCVLDEPLAWATFVAHRFS